MDLPDLLAPGTDAQPEFSGADIRDGAREGRYFRHDLGNGQFVQLLRQGGDGSDAPVAALVPLGIDGFDRIVSVSRLLAALHGRAVPADPRLTRQRRARLRRMLQAFDGHRAGATQQEIAQVIFRVDHVPRDEWQASSARHAVKSLLRDARAMIAGGYRRLLHHRRSK
ncbi:MAG TPA: DUF2285 domain-containing protein [Candidatus Defluviicoccus seviourii]|nr:DUF2285 domain-containing protein [Candidatus Defluviicoccus seviourii]